MVLFGRPLFIWFGVLAALFIFSAVGAVYLGRKNKRIAKNRWHQKLARVGVFFVVLHAINAIMRVF